MDRNFSQSQTQKTYEQLAPKQPESYVQLSFGLSFKSMHFYSDSMNTLSLFVLRRKYEQLGKDRQAANSGATAYITTAAHFTGLILDLMK